MKNSLVVLVCLLLSACLFPIIPTLKGGGDTEVSVYIENSKNKTGEQVKEQMLVCGYPGNYPLTDFVGIMPRIDYIKSNICMEKNEFRREKHNKSICHNKWFIGTGGPEAEQLCQAWLKEFKR